VSFVVWDFVLSSARWGRVKLFIPNGFEGAKEERAERGKKGRGACSPTLSCLVLLQDERMRMEKKGIRCKSKWVELGEGGGNFRSFSSLFRGGKGKT